MEINWFLVSIYGWAIGSLIVGVAAAFSVKAWLDMEDEDE